MSYRDDEKYALEMDNQDPLATYRNKFYIPKRQNGKGVIYLAGNSLGLQPKNAKSYVVRELEDWAKFGVEGHLQAASPWLTYHEFLTKSLSNLVGAKSIEIVAMNTLTVNLHLLMVSFYRPTETRNKILIEASAFPSDQYAVKSQLKYHNLKAEEALLEIEPRPHETYIRDEDFITLLENEGDSIALILIGGVNYYSGQVYNMELITKIGHKYGCIVGFDLAHAIGNIPLNLHDWGVDFAAWCSYKYLNGSPGCVAGVFVHERHANNPNLNRFTGWWGHEKSSRFKMPSDFVPIEGAEGWQLSNPPILPLAVLRSSLELFDEVGIKNLRKKSVQLTGYFEYLLKEKLSHKIGILTPSIVKDRGCQLSLIVKEKKRGSEIFEKLTQAGVMCDWREPDVIRCAPVPLYNSFQDVFDFVEILQKALNS